MNITKSKHDQPVCLTPSCPALGSGASVDAGRAEFKSSLSVSIVLSCDCSEPHSRVAFNKCECTHSNESHCQLHTL